MRYLRLLWTLTKGAFGSQQALAQIRNGMGALNAIDGVMGPYRRGDYETALQNAEGFRQDGEISPSYCFYRGANLSHLGRLAEAEVWLRRNVEMQKGRDERQQAVAHTTLGHLMLQFGRYDEAVDCFEASIRHFAERSSPYRSLAETCLLRGRESAEALRWAKLALDKVNGDQKVSAELRKLNLGEALATLAWATAATSPDASEVARLVDEAVASVGATSISSTAQVHYHCARAYQELGDAANSTKYFDETVRLDPQGEWGRAARTALANLVAN